MSRRRRCRNELDLALMAITGFIDLFVTFFSVAFTPPRRPQRGRRRRRRRR